MLFNQVHICRETACLLPHTAKLLLTLQSILTESSSPFSHPKLSRSRYGKMLLNANRVDNTQAQLWASSLS